MVPTPAPTEVVLAGCLDVDTALAYMAQDCSASSKWALEAHIDQCEECSDFVGEIARLDSQEQPSPLQAPRAEPSFVGQSIGRYVVRSVIGVGAMGVVYAAYDPQLDRNIALKVLRNSLNSESGAARLRREAQAMAKVESENVVRVFDVGMNQSSVFIAMEVIVGTTLGGWMQQEPRSWQSVVRVFKAAGQGLLAAHQAQLIHRDFKPENVLVSKDGRRVCVTDFGLVFSEESEEGWFEEGPIALTRDGSVVGTPAYMAPEQWNRSDVDPRTDQFSFCVCLYEAIYGQRPFAGDTMAILRESTCSGELQSLRGKGIETVPRRLHSLLLRGLKKNPDERFSTMQELLEELSAIETPKRKYWLFGAVLALALVGLAWIGLNAESKLAMCTGAKAQFSQVWNPELRAAVSDKLVGSPVTKERLLGLLDARGKAWVAGHTSACRATRVDGHQSEARLQERMQCLSGQREQFAALVHEMSSGEARTGDREIVAASALPEVRECEGGGRRASEKPGAPKAPAELRLQLEAVAAKMALGELASALLLSEKIRGKMDGVKGSSLQARASFLHAQLLEKSGEIDEALGEYEKMIPQAIQMHNEALVSRLWNAQVHLVGYLQRKHKEGKMLAQVAQVSLQRVTGVPELGLELQSYIAMIEYSIGNYSDAETMLRESLWAHEGLYGAQHPKTLQIQHNLGDTLLRQGKLAASAEVLEEVLEQREMLYGAHHSSVASTLFTIAYIDFKRGNYKLALQRYQRSLSVRIAAFGEDYPDVASSHVGVGVALKALGKLVEAQQHQERALTIWKKHYGPAHPSVAIALNNLANLLHQQGKNKRARGYLEEAYQIKKASLGAVHPELASTVFNLGEIVRAETGDCEQAMPYWQESLGIYQELDQGKDPASAYPLTSLGDCLLASGKAEEAVEGLERALDLRIAAQVDASVAAETRFALARALRSAGMERKRARRLAVEARLGYANNSQFKEEAARITTWLGRGQ